MGISAQQFWEQSTNGKAMLVMVAQRGDVETARDICDWLVRLKCKDIQARALKAGATQKQAELAGENAVMGMHSVVDGMNDRNCEETVVRVTDAIFRNEYNAGKAVLDRALADFANELRQRLKD